MSKSRARVKVKDAPVTRLQASAEFGRKKARQRRRQWSRRAMLIGSAMCVCYALGTGWWWVHTGKMEAMAQGMSASLWQSTASAGFRVQQVYLEGRSHADKKEVQAALGIKQGMPTLGVDLGEIKTRLQAIPEVKTVTITRSLPGSIRIVMTERVPAAVWQFEGQQKLVDNEGVVLNRDKYAGASELPVVVGEDAPKHVGELLALLDTTPSLKPDVVAAVRVGNRRWNVQLTRDIVVMLPEENPQAAWQRFAGLVEHEALLAKAIRSVDMRMEDRVFIMPTEQKQSPITLTNARDT